MPFQLVKEWSGLFLIQLMLLVLLQYLPSINHNLLKNAPHTADCIINRNWNYPYSPQEAAYPIEYLKEYKYWVPVRRVDNAFGDRNLICSCPSVESYEALEG